MNQVVIVAAKRSPIGGFGGSLKDITAVSLATQVLKATLKSIHLKPKEVDEVIVGNVLGAGLGQNIARQILIKSGIPNTSSAFTVNKVCGSGLKAVVLGAQSIMLGDNQVVVVGGTENMSRTPYLVGNHRFGNKMGHGQLVDLLLKDGLTDAFSGDHMGVTAEKIAADYQISRQEQDAFAANSQQKAEQAIKTNRFYDEIVPINFKNKKGQSITFTTDEHPRFGTTVETLSHLRPSFIKDGLVTAGNSSGINDGAAILVLMSEEKASELGIIPLAKIITYASGGIDPEVMGLGPIPATQKVLEKMGLTIKDIDLFEVNEAFASQSIAVGRQLNVDMEKVNVNGGAIALGHPIGASGARILVTLIHEMKKRKAKRGLATLCIGGGQGLSLLIESVINGKLNQ